MNGSEKHDVEYNVLCEIKLNIFFIKTEINLGCPSFKG